jgi:predicted enzyme related to lactoylglutathione lyase
VEYDIGAGTLCIGNGLTDWKPSRGGGSVGLEVDDFDAAMARLRSSDCKFVLEPLETPVCHMAVVSDPDDNSVTIHRRKAG